MWASVFIRGRSFLLAGVRLRGQSPGFVGGGGVVVVWWWGRWWLVVVGGGGSSGPVAQQCRWRAVLSCRHVRVVIMALSFGCVWSFAGAVPSLVGGCWVSLRGTSGAVHVVRGRGADVRGW